MASEFVCTPLDFAAFNPQGDVPDGSAGVYDQSKAGPFGEYKRTASPNAEKEKFYESTIVLPSGEPDHF